MTDDLPRREYGRELCGDLAVASDREWLVTNGLGGFASGTLGDVLTRRYHGLLFAARTPPLGRTLLLAKLEATVAYAGRDVELGTNVWASGVVAPQGYREIEHVRLDGTVPTWRYAFSDVRLERTIWMADGANTTYVRYALLRAGEAVTLTLRALVNARDYHALTRAHDVGDPVRLDGRVARVRLGADAPVLTLASDRGDVRRGAGWYDGFHLAAETERGLDDREDHYNAVDFTARLEPGESLTILATAESGVTACDGAAALAAHVDRETALLARWRATRPTSRPAPAWMSSLVLAADRFVVARGRADERGRTIVAGYPWFGDWGRDTMIALPGLALATGRYDVAREILATFARFLDRGMLPNRFPDAGEAPEYNTVDATLWFVEAMRQYVEASGDRAFARPALAAIDEIVTWHCAGTRYGIRVDDTDGLLYAGEPGVALTWMDANVDGYVVTPRIGKAVEINALWYRALLTACAFAHVAGTNDGRRYAALAARAGRSFERFWNEPHGYCFDVIDGPDGDDPAIRPNAVIAASLAASPLSRARRARIVRTAARTLLTTCGLRSLTPEDPRYVGRYGGDRYARDTAYHQGTVWPWLLGPFASAHVGAFGDAAAALAFLDGMRHLVDASAIGTLAEIADGDAPHHPRGCIAQAWSVGEIVRAWTHLERAGASPHAERPAGAAPHAGRAAGDSAGSA